MSPVLTGTKFVQLAETKLRFPIPPAEKNVPQLNSTEL